MAAFQEDAPAQAYHQKPLGAEPWMQAFDRIYAQFWAKVASRQANASPNDQRIQIQPMPVRSKDQKKHPIRTPCRVLKGKRMKRVRRPNQQGRQPTMPLHSSSTTRHSGWGRIYVRKSRCRRVPTQRHLPHAPKGPSSHEPTDGPYRSPGGTT
ncbi:Hypothetical predicted protein [Pelobates cultripes]|uniref:Uncharacterized protein n=1 Tax=Pelobates cultripes TaxID=61616 RepID=A0AAD1RU00_PELCU|nr:Hypothetical predicted protein [Pelobates cultripes]